MRRKERLKSRDNELNDELMITLLIELLVIGHIFVAKNLQAALAEAIWHAIMLAEREKQFSCKANCSSKHLKQVILLI